jgi:DNA-directed RNA polymerase specialized sigma24 family protein
MSRSRRFFEPNDDRSSRGPSDEMLAVDAASELRSMALLYERWADRLYRYFLLSTADPSTADRMMRDLIARLPEELQRFAAQDRSFAGWLFSRASEVFWREYSVPSRMYRRVYRYLPSRSKQGAVDGDASGQQGTSVFSGFEEISDALKAMPPDRREVLGIQFGAGLRTAPAAEALRLPASLMSSHVQWAMESLAEQLEVANTRRLTEDVSEIINRQTLTSQQRQRHFALLNGVFLGEIEVESDDQERAPIFEISALVGVVVLGLIGIWIWGLITEGDTREHEAASSPVEIVAEDDDDDGEMEPTPTVEPEPTPEPEETDAIAEGPSTCTPNEGMTRFDQFVENFNNGDFAALHQMLPLDYLQSEEEESGIDTPYFLHGGTSLDNRFEVSSFLRERYNEGERWDVLEAYPAEHYRNWQGSMPLEMYQDWKRENPEQAMIVVTGLDWSGSAQDQEIALGRVIIDCSTHMVTSWELQAQGDQAAEPVSVNGFLAVMEPLQAGEIRSLISRVRVDSRDDGGLLQNWMIIWSEATLSDGTESERIQIHALDGTHLISYVNDGNRWSLNQRGWQMAGREDVPLPDEITVPMEWLPRLPELLANLDVSVDSTGDERQQFSTDVSPEGPSGIERELTLEIQDGAIGPLVVHESSPTDDRIRPEIRLLSIDRQQDFDEQYFRVEDLPGFPETDVTLPRYTVPDDEFSQLDLVAVIVDDDQTRELYRIRWNEIEMDLTVRPSRGGLDIYSVPPSLDESWSILPASYRWGTFVWAYRQFAGYPTDALWDDGRHLFDLSVDRQSVSPEHNWNLPELITLVDLLSVDLGDEVYIIDENAGGEGGGAGVARTSFPPQVGFSH